MRIRQPAVSEIRKTNGDVAAERHHHADEKSASPHHQEFPESKLLHVQPQRKQHRAVPGQLSQELQNSDNEQHIKRQALQLDELVAVHGQVHGHGRDQQRSPPRRRRDVCGTVGWSWQSRH